jgi:hypothetical protein
MRTRLQPNRIRAFVALTLLVSLTTAACGLSGSPAPAPMNPMGFAATSDRDGVAMEVRSGGARLFEMRISDTTARAADARGTPLGRVVRRDGDGFEVLDRRGQTLCTAAAATFGLLMRCGLEPNAYTMQIAERDGGRILLETAGQPVIEITSDAAAGTATLRYLPDGALWNARTENGVLHVVSPEGQQWELVPARVSTASALALVIPPSVPDEPRATMERVALAWRIHRLLQAATENAEEASAAVEPVAEQGSGEGSGSDEAAP